MMTETKVPAEAHAYGPSLDRFDPDNITADQVRELKACLVSWSEEVENAEKMRGWLLEHGLMYAYLSDEGRQGELEGLLADAKAEGWVGGPKPITVIEFTPGKATPVEISVEGETLGLTAADLAVRVSNLEYAVKSLREWAWGPEGVRK